MILKQKRFLELAFILLISVVFSVANSFHVITQWLANPPGRVFTGIAHYFADYFLYVDIMAQGADGHLSAATHFTNEILPPMAFYWFNTILGWLGHLVGLSPFATYNFAVVILIFLLCLLWFKLCRLLFPNNRLARWTAFLFILTASSFINPKNFFENSRLDLLFPFWFSPAPALNRLGGVPHQIFQTILLVFLPIAFSKFLDDIVNRRKNSFFSNAISVSLLTFLTALSNPMQLLLVLVGIGLTTLWHMMRKTKKANIATHPMKRLLLLCTPGIVAFVVGIPSLILSRLWLTHPIIPSANAWEAWQYQQIPPLQLLLAVGPVAILALFGIIPYLRRATTLRIMYISYGFLSFVTFYSPLSSVTGTAIARWLHPAPYAILGILGAEGMLTITNWLSDKYQTMKNKRLVYTILYSSFIVLYFLFTLPALYSQIDARTNPKLNTVLTSDLNHVPKPVVDALMWLKNQKSFTPDVGATFTSGVVFNKLESNVVLTDPALPYDVLIPVFTGKISFTGHPIHTLYPDVKENLRQRFFKGEMSQPEAKKFLTDHRIGYTLSQKLSLPYATKIFFNASVSVFIFNTATMLR